MIVGKVIETSKGKKNECVYFMHLTLNGKYEKKKVAVSLIYIYRMRLMNLLQKTNTQPPL